MNCDLPAHQFVFGRCIACNEPVTTETAPRPGMTAGDGAGSTPTRKK